MSPRLGLFCFALCLPVSPVRANRDLLATFKIRQQCAQFDSQSQNATRRTVIVFGMAHEGSEITALELKGQTRKMHVTHLGTQGQRQETIYLENGRLIRVTRIETIYDAPLSGRVVERKKEELYFQQGRLIQRDLRPTNPVGRAGSRRFFIHQTFIASPAQAREWKAKALHWQRRVTLYKTELNSKRKELPTSPATAANTAAAATARKT